MLWWSNAFGIQWARSIEGKYQLLMWRACFQHCKGFPFNIFFWWLYSNCGPLESEATALATEPQPLPKQNINLRNARFPFYEMSSLSNWVKFGIVTNKCFCFRDLFTQDTFCWAKLWHIWIRSWSLNCLNFTRLVSWAEA